MTKKEALVIALSNLTADTYTLIRKDVHFSDGHIGDSSETFTGDELRETLASMITQLSKPRKVSDEAKAKRKEKNAQARNALMVQVLPIIRDGISDGGTAKEIFERCKDALPNDFTDKKVQYILLHEMKDEVEKIEAKNKPNVYKLKKA